MGSPGQPQLAFASALQLAVLWELASLAIAPEPSARVRAASAQVAELEAFEKQILLAVEPGLLFLDSIEGQLALIVVIILSLEQVMQLLHLSWSYS